jgi:hypothetical protein
MKAKTKAESVLARLPESAPTAKDFARLSDDTQCVLDSSKEDPRVGSAAVTSDDGGKTFYLRTDKYDKSFKSADELVAYLQKGGWTISGWERRE